jgi:hypothetical protein
MESSSAPFVGAAKNTTGSVKSLLTLLWLYLTDEDPVEPVATCGDCYCIVDEGQDCPTPTPRTDYDDAFLAEFTTPQPTNAFPTLKCNPYKDPTCEQPGAGTNKVCGVLYSNDCALYSIENFDDQTQAEEAGAMVLHTEGCGVCSTLQDLAVQMKNTDLRNEGEACSQKTLLKFADGVQCFIDVGFTPPCADLWAKNALSTTEGCFGICFVSDATDSPNNGPPPQCELEDCLQCDEDFSGPVFQKVAGLTRRSAGLLSDIARPCDMIANIVHQACVPN